MRQYAVIVAGGSGSRMGGGIPKQFRSLCGKPMLWWTMKSFHDENPSTEIILVLPEAFLSIWQDFFQTLPPDHQFNHKIVTGGSSRTESVKNGLDLIQDYEALIAIHDGARPLVTVDLIKRGWEAALSGGAGVPVVPVIDSLRVVENGTNHAIDRSDYRAVQTPQVFLSKLLKKAYEEIEDKSFSDDASVVENLGHKIILFEGDPRNIKVTTPIDMELASILIGKDG